MNKVEIIPIESSHISDVLEIYNYYIRTSIITFELDEIDLEEMTRRVNRISASFPFIVALRDNKVVGYAYADKWRTRQAYSISVESTIYLNNDVTGLGIGKQLYTQLIELLRSAGFKNAIGGIALPNDASIALHEKCGFRKVAEFVNVGIKFGRAINVGYWQLEL